MDGLTTDESRILGRMHAECDELRAERDDLLEVCRLLVVAEPMQWGYRNGAIMGQISKAIDAAKDAIAKHEGK